MSLKPGTKAPEIELRDQNGNMRRSKDLRGKTLVLFFYPKDDTPVCTIEACSFRDSYQIFKTLGAEVWGVSSDNESTHKKFTTTNNLPFPLLSDKNNMLRSAFKVPKTLGIIPGRVTYVIDSKGIIRNVFNNLLDGNAHISNTVNFLKEQK